VIASAQWQWILLGAGPGDGGTSHRVARRHAAGGSDLVYSTGTDTPMSDSWVSSPSAPSTIDHGGDEYVRAFWSVTAHDSMSSQGSAQIQAGTGTANDSHFGGSWDVTAKLYYIDRGGVGVPGGDGAVLIDAFDIQAGDFFPDDFVDVTPDPGHTLTPAANDGYIDTTSQIQQPTALTIAARDSIPGKQFGYWWSIDSLLASADPLHPATVGSPDSHAIVAHHNDDVVAFAFYNEVQNRRWVPPNYWLYNPWWWIETHGGLVPPGPVDPFRVQLEAVSQILEATRFLSGEVRTRGIELALHQLSIAETSIRQELSAVQKGLQQRSNEQ
jgi:hypothetical protein